MSLFPTDLASIQARIDAIDPVAYGHTRNYTDGAVTRLSPYISRGVISTRQVLQRVLARGYRLHAIESFVKELAWRDYFQRVWQERDVDEDLRRPQEDVRHYELPSALPRAATGIDAVDAALRDLFRTGYLHNHCRMYVAALACNIGRAHWRSPARWLYYHLLDGDWGSNACSWQWVAGSNSNKKYVANQENISRFTRTALADSYLDRPVEELLGIAIPPPLIDTEPFVAETQLPATATPRLDPSLPVYLYNYYHLDPLWRAHETANRVLLLEPELFARYPVSPLCIDFMLRLAEGISDLQIFTGSFAELRALHPGLEFVFREHPLNRHYTGTADAREWLSSAVSGYFPSFFAYWKRLEPALKKEYA
ncbi:FAD-binding domain-containing protein [Flaviaesturariibacter amylovorans]|uniref:Cryptochrome/DNA photolyase FAD-binding domain-containing protein n=1 Tax=Flaviaesturariibacter amylovorans TaxID=1084520 RepID=A0ABP8G6V3_9BACT